MSSHEIKLDAKDVVVGMYVSRLDRPWLETPFMLQGFMINDDEDLDLLKQNCEYCYVDSQRSKHFDPSKVYRAQIQDNKGVIFGVKQKPKDKSELKKVRIYRDQVEMKDELEHVRSTHRSMSVVVKDMLTTFRLKKKIDVQGARKEIGRAHV